MMDAYEERLARLDIAAERYLEARRRGTFSLQDLGALRWCANKAVDVSPLRLSYKTPQRPRGRGLEPPKEE